MSFYEALVKVDNVDILDVDRIEVGELIEIIAREYTACSPTEVLVRAKLKDGVYEDGPFQIVAVEL
jgi:hypothetical protein